ncbi:conserved membrane protein of unknown function [Nitrospira sp. KM1]|uniref:phosphatase PAP2 family protein n=1 Tax=Nitrospira sp. KM1 TaxID=1936990 RepID=UPI0013A7A226|nr:phosphatase PAP2 family protein [Nitrospira sp. KM1]BCA54963.1 conserved membrane protein of unknown function [Nitrospira sp. KM1]
MATGDRTAQVTHRTWRIAALMCAGVACTLSFLCLFEWDVPLTKFVRSLYHPVGYLPNPWLSRFSDSGDLLGKGEWLVLLSLMVLAVGYLRNSPIWKVAGWQSLLAHGIAALISNALKHAIGRARPKFMHAGNLELSPGGGSGWDSFPSGHATASFGVVTVLALRFPKVRWLLFAFAGAIAASRILRGSHFLTDTVGGAIIGYLTGSLVGNHWKEWGKSLESALTRAAIVVTGFSASLWVLCRQPADEWTAHALIFTGTVLAALGLAVVLGASISKRQTDQVTALSLVRGLTVIGLGMVSGSIMIAIATASAYLAHWFQSYAHQAPLDSPQGDVASVAGEAAFSLFVLVALLTSIQFRGALPLI